MGVKLLKDIFVFFGMEVDGSEGVFQLPERGLYAPPEPIDALHLLKRDLISRQVCNQDFPYFIACTRFVNLKLANTEFNGAFFFKIPLGSRSFL